MYELLELSVNSQEPLFPRESDRRYLMGLIQKLTLRRGIQLLAFRLEERRVLLLLRGEERSIRECSRLIRSGYRVWRYHQGASLRWREPGRFVVESEEGARGVADELHRIDAGDPLSFLWSSLRDGLGLRRAPWFDPGWLASAEPELLYRAAGGRSAPPGALPERAGGRRARDPWGMLVAAVAAATGVGPEERAVRWIQAQVAARQGWSIKEVSAQMMTSELTVRRLLDKEDEAAVERTLLHLNDARLRCALATESRLSNRRERPLEARCSPQRSSWNKPVPLSLEGSTPLSAPLGR